MYEDFDQPSRTKILRDSQRIPRALIHDQYVVSGAGTAQLAAQEYLGRFRGLAGLSAGELASLSLPPESDPIGAGAEYRFLTEKAQFDTTTVSYYQTFFGLPVWEAGLCVYMKQAPFRVISAQVTGHPDLEVGRPTAKAVARLKKLNAQTLGKLLGIAGKRTAFNARSLKVQRRRLMIYRYDASKRGNPPDAKARKAANALPHDHPILPLAPVDRGIAEGRHYVVAAVYFSLQSRKFGMVNWVALVEAETLSVLYLRAFVDGISGMVFPADPRTLAGGPAATANNTLLNPLRSSVTLDGLKPPVAGMCSLSGDIIEVQNFADPPPAIPPTVPPGTDFTYQARTDNFAAVNAYYHCDQFFRLIEDLGFPRASYFSHTTFPLPVDHRGKAFSSNGIVVNACCNGNPEGVGLKNVEFALADMSHHATDPIGMACDRRMVLHELGGHGILYNHINKGSFGFAHSAGDSFAAILNDPDSQAYAANPDDRFLTFPWITDLPPTPIHIRCHNRSVADGWAWGGTKDLGWTEADRGYQSEQILSTTQFRIYRSIGGDSGHPAMRRFAAQFVSYLMLRAIGDMTPATDTNHVDVYIQKLLGADKGDWTTKGHAGGAYGKVIRWAFEKQGFYQPTAAPTPVTTEGDPPPVDVYIDDGRGGQYGYQPNHWGCQAIWNRLANDGGTIHQEPVVGASNFAFVKIKNRGTQMATGVTVKAFHCKPAAGLVYPDDWQPMTTAELPAPNVPSNSAAEITVGPFEWEPSHVGHECMFMVVSAPGDLSNIDNFEPGESIPEWRLVPQDNNIGQRNVCPVDGSSTAGLCRAFLARPIYVKNPHDKRARMVIRPVLPPLLVERNWQFEFASSGGSAFSLEFSYWPRRHNEAQTGPGVQSGRGQKIGRIHHPYRGLCRRHPRRWRVVHAEPGTRGTGRAGKVIGDHGTR